MLQSLNGFNNRKCDEQISYELKRARIPMEYMERSAINAIPYGMIVMLPGFAFTRAWNRWVVKGAIPLTVAEELYTDPVGNEDLRANGFGQGTLPGPVSDWLVHSSALNLVSAGRNELKQFTENFFLREVPSDWFAVPPDMAESVGAERYVLEYHITSEIGLRVFVDTLRAHDLVAEPEPIAA